MASDYPWTQILLLAFASLTLWALYTLVWSWDVRRRGLQRIARLDDLDDGETSGNYLPGPSGWLGRWLSLAGFRRARAVFFFGVAVLVALAAATLLALVFRATTLDSLIQTVGNIPGGIGDALVAILSVGPWIIFFTVAISPILAVRAARRRRVREIEQDLSLALELFATLAEAGLGFDAALARIVQAQALARPLTSELTAFQRDLQAGVARLQALRHLSERIDVMSMTIFVSAIIQSEQVGSSLAETLRHQADDLRSRRREQALLRAQALPVKLVFPLIACFLPGIFLSTLGPVLFQMIQVADSVLRSSGR